VPTPRYRLLVADPDRLQLQLIDMLLATGEYDLAMLETGREALEFLRANSPDLCLLALDLPDVAGDVICGKLRRVTRLARTPVILVAPQSGGLGLSDRDRARARRAGADLILPRPLGDKNLRQRVQDLLDAREATPTREGYTTRVIDDALEDLGGEPVAGPPGGGPGGAPMDGDEDPLAPPDEFVEPSPAAGADRPERPPERPREARAEPPREPPPAPDPAPDDEPGPTPMRGRASAGSLSDEGDEGRDAPFAAVQRELESLRMENKQLRRKLREKDEALEKGVNPKLQQRIGELERRNQALLDRIEELEQGGDGGRGGGLFGRRR
jgi:CheY-like chemotaxis protein